jgi:hypothetical protein
MLSFLFFNQSIKILKHRGKKLILSHFSRSIPSHITGRKLQIQTQTISSQRFVPLNSSTIHHRFKKKQRSISSHYSSFYENKTCAMSHGGGSNSRRYYYYSFYQFSPVIRCRTSVKSRSLQEFKAVSSSVALWPKDGLGTTKGSILNCS